MSSNRKKSEKVVRKAFSPQNPKQIIHENCSGGPLLRDGMVVFNARVKGNHITKGNYHTNHKIVRIHS